MPERLGQSTSGGSARRPFSAGNIQLHAAAADDNDGNQHRPGRLIDAGQSIRRYVKRRPGGLVGHRRAICSRARAPARRLPVARPILWLRAAAGRQDERAGRTSGLERTRMRRYAPTLTRAAIVTPNWEQISPPGGRRCKATPLGKTSRPASGENNARCTALTRPRRAPTNKLLPVPAD